MYLLLMRHGHAQETSGPEGRPLSERGRQEAVRVANIISEVHGMRVASVFHSPKLRAAQTARTLASVMSPEPSCEERDFLLPLDNISVWASRVAEAVDDLALVGHMPFMAELTMHLLREAGDYRTIRFSTAQAVCLQRNNTLWEWQWTAAP